MLALRGHRRNFADGLLQRHELLVAHILAKKARHRAERARMRMLFVQRTVKRSRSGIEPDGSPGLLQAGDQILLAGHEVQRAGLAFVRDDKVHQRVELRFALRFRNVGDGFTVKLFSSGFSTPESSTPAPPPQSANRFSHSLWSTAISVLMRARIFGSLMRSSSLAMPPSATQGGSEEARAVPPAI